MSPIAQAAAAALESMGWTIERLAGAPDGEHHWILEPPGDEPDHPVVVVVHDEPSTVVCYSVVPDDVPAAGRPAVLEFLTRANYGLLEGGFEIDLDDGEARFKTSVHAVEFDHLDRELAHALSFNLAVFGMYSRGLAAVAGGASSPADAITMIENG